MEKTVTVIVTCYNHEAYIEECLRSIFNQTYSNITLLVFNDGSTDNSEAVIQSVLKDSPYAETSYFYHDNQGLVKTRNRGLDMVETDYVLFVDSDNSLENNYLEALVTVAEEQEADIVYTTIKNLETQEVILPAQEFQLERLYAENFIESCSLIRTSILSGERYDLQLNYKKLEDHDLFLNLIVNHNAKASPCYNTHLNYRVLASSMSAREDLRYHYEVYTYILGKYFEKNPEFGKSALQTSVIRLHDSLVNLISDYQLSIFYDRGQGFSEEDKDSWSLSVQALVDFSIDSDVKAIRIDLGELPNYFKKVSLFDSDKSLLEPVWTNGFEDDGSYFFTIRDPQLVYDVSDRESRTYSLAYEMYHLYNKHEARCVDIALAQRVEELTESMLEAEKIREAYHRTQELLADTKQKLADVELNYATVVGSRRWTIATRIINLFRRRK